MTMGKVNKIALSTNDNKRLDFSLIDLISLWDRSQKKVWKAKLMRYTKNKNFSTMINLDGVVGESRQEHIPRWPQIPVAIKILEDVSGKTE